MKLNLITPVSRPQHLPAIRAAIRERFTRLNVHWWVVADLSRCTLAQCGGHGDTLLTGRGPDAGGGSLRNVALDRIDSGWIAFVDDDNTPHPAFEGRLLAAIEEGHDGLVVSQERGWDGRHLWADPRLCRLARLDTAMMAFDFAAVRDLRFLRDVYESDWWYFADARERCRSLKYDLTLAASYNALTPGAATSNPYSAAAQAPGLARG